MIFFCTAAAFFLPFSLFAMDWEDHAILTKNNSPITQKAKTNWLYTFGLEHDDGDAVYIDTTSTHVTAKVFSPKGYCDYLSIDCTERKIDFIRLKITTDMQVGPHMDLYDNSERLFSLIFSFPPEYEYLLIRRRHSKIVALFVEQSRVRTQNNNAR